ncbi:MAG: hypothetical protein WC596_04625 [Candidatus Shapirobacteria bacterium]
MRRIICAISNGMKVYYPAAQKTSKSKIKLIVFLLVFAFLALVFGGGYLVYASDFFKIKNIEVAGVKDFSQEDLVASLKDFFKNQSKISSFLGPDNILVWRAEASPFLAKNPQLKNLNIEKDIFNRSVKINAQEREKFGIWCLEINSISDQETTSSTLDNGFKEENCYWFDKEGVVFVEAPVIEGELFNKVIDSTGRNLKSGDKVLDDRLLENFVKVFEVFDAVNLKSKTIFINDLKTEEIAVMPAGFPKTLFSLRFDPRFSIVAIDILKKSGRWQKVEYADFRVENKVYYKFK